MALNLLSEAGRAEDLGTTELSRPNSGFVLLDNRAAAVFEAIRSTAPSTVNPDYNFTPREISEITKSLVEIELGNVRSTYDTEELFKELEGK